MKKTVKRIWNIVTTALIAMVVILAVLLVGVRLTGLHIYTVLSGSMEPTYHVGSVIYVKEVDPEALESGDVITYQLDDDTVATHRIIEVVELDNETAFRTKGDANEAADGGAVPARQVIGTPVFTVPYLGYLAQYLYTTSGRYAAVAVGATLLLLIILPDILFGDEKKAKEKTE